MSQSLVFFNQGGRWLEVTPGGQLGTKSERVLVGRRYSEPQSSISQHKLAASEHMVYSCLLVTVNPGAAISLFDLTTGSFQSNVTLS